LKERRINLDGRNTGFEIFKLRVFISSLWKYSKNVGIIYTAAYMGTVLKKAETGGKNENKSRKFQL
jgi:hypothetical protein